jgi:hypothetical protein
MMFRAMYLMIFNLINVAYLVSMKSRNKYQFNVLTLTNKIKFGILIN